MTYSVNNRITTPLDKHAITCTNDENNRKRRKISPVFTHPRHEDNSESWKSARGHADQTIAEVKLLRRPLDEGDSKKGEVGLDAFLWANCSLRGGPGVDAGGRENAAVAAAVTVSAR